MLIRSVSFVVEAQLVLLYLSKKSIHIPAVMLVRVLIISFFSCQTLNVLFTKKTPTGVSFIAVP